MLIQLVETTNSQKQLILFSMIVGVLLSILSGCQISEDNKVIGYVENSLFHPLIVVEGDSIYAANSAVIEITGMISDSFERNGDISLIEKSEDYVDPYTDESGQYGIIKDSVREVDRFYVLNDTLTVLPKESNNEQIVQSFFTFFSADEWGSHFFYQSDWMALPLQKLYAKTGIRVQYSTDFDRDGLIELWITYELMNGEIGHMIYEQTSDKSSWRLLTNRCFACD